MKRKIKIVASVFVAICTVYIIAVNVYDKIEYAKLPFGEKILEAVNTDDFMSEDGKGSADKIIYLEDVDDGYFCIAASSEYEELSFCYVRENNGKFEYAGKSFGNTDYYIYNEDPTLIHRTKILNFSETDWYYGFYQHKDGVRIKADGKEVPIKTLSINYKGKDFSMDFWLVCKNEQPTVEII